MASFCFAVGIFSGKWISIYFFNSCRSNLTAKPPDLSLSGRIRSATALPSKTRPSEFLARRLAPAIIHIYIYSQVGHHWRHSCQCGGEEGQMYFGEHGTTMAEGVPDYELQRKGLFRKIWVYNYPLNILLTGLQTIIPAYETIINTNYLL